MRAVPRPLPLSIADWLVPWRERAWPLDWAAELGRNAPLALEIGFGNGEFLAREAQRRPDRNHVGIELSWTSATHLFRRLDQGWPDQGGTPRVRALLADAEVALEHLFAPGSLAAAFLNHPSPWPKDRHAARRFVRPQTLRLLATRMSPAAELSIVTDHAAYAAQIAALLEAQRDFAPLEGTTEVAAIPGREPTKYQRKAMAEGVPIHYFRWVRAGAHATQAPVAAPATPFPNDPMPSLTLNGRVAPERLFHGIAPDVETSAPREVATVVRLASVYRREGDAPAWLIETLVKEERLQQQFAIEVAPRGGDGLLIKLSVLGHPHPTFGVKRAVWLVGAWLRRAHPELGLAHHNLGDVAEER
jgi:tRNA (guanine-N7-)-methyltransferase